MLVERKEGAARVPVTYCLGKRTRNARCKATTYYFSQSCDCFPCCWPGCGGDWKIHVASSDAGWKVKWGSQPGPAFSRRPFHVVAEFQGLVQAKKMEAADLLRPSPEMTGLLLSHSIGQNNSWGHPRVKGKEIRLHLLMRELAMT